MSEKFKKIIGLILIVSLSVFIFLFRDKLINFESYGYLGIFVISVLGNATIVLPVPVILTAFLGGGIFNPLLVGLISSFGATIGELTGYIAGRSGRVVVKDNSKFEKIEKWMAKYGMWTIFVLAVIPNPAFDLAGIVSGATKIPVWKYFLVTWAGKFIKFLTFAYIGSGSSKMVETLT
ncbi:MAG: VTT domain-containing protein [Patescibacteria group bacterium]